MSMQQKTILAGRLRFDPCRFTVEEVPVPAPGPGEVPVAVKAAGMCLSDVHLIDSSLSSRSIGTRGDARPRGCWSHRSNRAGCHRVGDRPAGGASGRAVVRRVRQLPAPDDPVPRTAARLEKRIGDPIRPVLVP